MVTSIEAQIAEEERLIEIYQAELALLKIDDRRNKDNATASKSPFRFEDEESSQEENESSNNITSSVPDPLDWIMQQEEASVSSLMESLNKHQKELQPQNSACFVLQPYLRGFNFTSVERLDEFKNRDSLPPATPRDQAEYELRGFFVKRPEFTATIYFRFQLKSNSTEARILSMDCKLDHPQKGYENLLGRGRRGATTTTFAQWIDRISNFIDFDDRRNKCIDKWKHESLLLQDKTEGLNRIISFGLGDEDSGAGSNKGQSKCISLVWGWKEGQEFLRFTADSAHLGLQQIDLDYLVRACGGAFHTAIQKMLPTPENILACEKDTRKQLETTETAEFDADDEQSAQVGEQDEASVASTASRASETPRSPSGRKLSDYEIFRLERIKRNQEYLAKLGLDGMHSESTNAPAKPRTKPRKKKRKQLRDVLRSMPKRRRNNPDMSDGQPSDHEDLSNVSYREVTPSAKGRLLDDGCLPPIKPPTKDEDGLFNRPKGRPPNGFDWDPSRGLWIPLGGQTNINVSLPSLPWKSRIDENGCVRANVVVKRNFDGTYTKPRGKPPSGYKWDMFRGLYIPLDREIAVEKPKNTNHTVNDDSFREIKRTPGVPESICIDHNDMLSPGAISAITHRPSISGSILRSGEGASGEIGIRQEIHHTSESSRLSPNVVTVNAGAHTLRSETTSLQKSDGTFAAQGGPPEDGGNNSANIHGSTDRETEALGAVSGKSGTSIKNRRLPNGCVKPKRIPAKRSDGTYRVPAGKPMKGYFWDAKAGLWCPLSSQIAEKWQEAAPSNSGRGTSESIVNRLEHESPSDPKKEPVSIFTNNKKKSRLVVDKKDSSISRKKRSDSKKNSSVSVKNRTLEDGSVLPSSTPLRNPDGTFAMPRGRSLKGFEWDCAMGLWLPSGGVGAGLEKDKKDERAIVDLNSTTREVAALKDAGTPSTDPVSLAKSKSPARRTTETPTEPSPNFPPSKDGVIQPVNTPKKNPDGTFALPRGNTMKGHKWDALRGCWVAKDQPKRNIDGGKTKLSLKERTLADGSVRPVVAPKKSKSGIYSMPRGKPLKGFKWNSTRGVWEPLTIGLNLTNRRPPAALRNIVLPKKSNK